MARFSVLIAFLLSSILPFAASGTLRRAVADDGRNSTATIPVLKPALQKLVEEGKVPGGVTLVAHRGRVVDITTFGYRDMATKTPMTEDTIFAIASMTKPITCVAAMTLVEQELMKLDDPVAKYLPEFADQRVLGDPRDDTGNEVATIPVMRPVTIRHLLTHTSGISYGVFDSSDARLKNLYKQAGVVGPRHKTLAELVARLARVPLAHQPGEGWTYGFSHDVLARVIEVASGQSFDQFLQERIFTPLDMRDTSFQVPPEKRNRVATIYDAGEGGALTALPIEYGSESFCQGGGGLFSTARDYARFAQMLLNDGALEGARIIESETVAAMTTNQIGALSAFGERKYGLGLGLAMATDPNGGTSTLERYFGGGAYSTNFYILPRRDLVLVLMQQVTPTNHGGADQAFYRIVNAAIEK